MPQAPRAPLPELAELLAPLRVHFTQGPSAETLRQYLTGLYFWSDFPAPTPQARMVEYAHRRHGVEQYHEEANTERGWDQYQGRRWDGFHRHAVTIMLSYSFLVWLESWERERCPRRGRPRAAFSPTPGPPPRAATGTPSSRQRMAAPCRPPRIDRIGAH